MALSKADKVLIALYEIARRSENAISYEDLVVKAFQKFPQDFALRGYPQYPDASDVHKPIYNHLKPKGLVSVSQKTFKLTDSGRRAAQALLGDQNVGMDAARLSRSEEATLERLRHSAAARLVTEGKAEELIDTDCQRFYGFAAWTRAKEAPAYRVKILALIQHLGAIDAETAALLSRTDMELSARFPQLFKE